MRRICAWCGADIDPGHSGMTAHGPITHGICGSCAKAFWEDDEGTPLREFLASLPVPTFLVDGGGWVRTTNPQTLEMVGKSREEAEGHLGGEVFNCVNAELEGGCGSTELCPACTVRNTVTETFESGRSQVRIPATLRVRNGGKVAELEFFLTTEKAGDRVLVQIEPMEGNSE